mmetsp:Transcript_17204/g.28789  ORF Transcript_17204/g.28789 Transcript_17204/m.28789 type:complete len:379 (+) Transcript_17204:16-1152(+)|eukprot:CAMPEP_0114474564 /NCGR_PEP_ID=MMETSP0104-20121206/13644_1 /TAXON_ID=37642 ORGANISM="Paraphysomonas imperforata, Strain PA2" /NCGR_SAMPLE_ID=MMETSP0104 /ASSEMBLY_ACC=CAM_ASM_000202 /LENGTH=378 /DNA_ID=CAMNT_0001648947 /DNA_START=16 /DNA_END=1152 /DNA_ORIENTATION=-
MHTIIAELRSINSDAGRVTLRQNRAWNGRREFTQAAKPIRKATKINAATAAIHPALQGAEAIVEAVVNLFSKDWQGYIRAQFAALPDMPGEAKLIFVFTTLSSLVLFCKCRNEGQSFTEAMKSALGTVAPYAGIATMLATIQKYIGNPLAKNIMQGLMAEADVVATGILGASISGFIAGMTWDLVENCMKLKKNGDWRDFGDRMLKSFVSNATKGVIYGAIAVFCPVPLTVAVCIFGAFAEADMLEKFKDHKQPYVVSLGQFVWRTVTYVPYSMYDLLIASEDEVKEQYAYRLELLECHCPSLVCSVTYEILDDPVFLNGAVVSRDIAERQVNQLGRDFYNDREVTLEDIKELPELARLVRKAKRIVEGLRDANDQPK